MSEGNYSLCGTPIKQRVEPLTPDVHAIRKQLMLEHVRDQVQACLAALHKESSRGPPDPKLSPVWLALLTAETEINNLFTPR